MNRLLPSVDADPAASNSHSEAAETEGLNADAQPLPAYPQPAGDPANSTTDSSPSATFDTSAGSSMEPTTNPLGSSLAITVSVPDKIHIKMVNASTLSDYEVWVLLASFACNFFVGFLIVMIQTWDGTFGSVARYVAMTVFCATIFAVFLWQAVAKRTVIKEQGKEVVLETRAARVLSQ